MSERAPGPTAERLPPTVPLTGVLSERLGLVDAVDHVLNRGALVVGEATISVGGVDLIYLGLNLLVSSVETLRKTGVGGGGPALPGPSREGGPAPVASVPTGSGSAFQGSAPGATSAFQGGATLTTLSPTRPSAGPEEGLARLVLTLVELLRQILERQATRRIEGDDLTDEQVERLGLALMELEGKMKELCDVFGLEPGDLNLDLGPLGQLL